ncbi:MAG: response regulator transcription factor [Acidimicrobiales bacterium]|nr:response regulator transcription factor [Acidimicrobiales bacterium]
MNQDSPARILVVEDDEGIGAGLVRALDGAGHDPIWVRTSAEATAADVDEVDLVLLDLGLPDGDGLDLCRQLHDEEPDLPILILTARSTETDIVVGLDAGADDYLIKPFRLAELLARIRALLRRQPAESPDVVEVGDVRVDNAARRVHVDGTELNLRQKEFDLLSLLIRHAGTVVTRDDAMEQVWDEHWFGSTKTLDVTLASLRQHLGEPRSDQSRITTLRGVGFRFEIPDSRR